MSEILKNPLTTNGKNPTASVSSFFALRAKKALEKNNVDLYIRNIEQQKKVTIERDTEEEFIKIFSEKGDIIGEFSWGEYHVGDEKIEDHVLREVEDSYKGQGLATILHNIWVMSGFKIPDFEYSRNFESTGFLQKIGYTPLSCVNDVTGEESDFEDFDLLGQGFSCKFVLES